MHHTIFGIAFTVAKERETFSFIPKLCAFPKRENENNIFPRVGIDIGDNNKKIAFLSLVTTRTKANIGYTRIFIILYFLI